jgi:catechol 2,3-dioxygenase-like lactoylglutathione lyase family enzyme
MKNFVLIIAALAATFCLGFSFKTSSTKQADSNQQLSKPVDMKLGAFSMSLSVKDLETSKQFYEKLGFTVFGGAMNKRYLIMKNEHTLIGLFQGMFQGNILTFNPGWNDMAKNIDPFDDVRAIQQQLKNSGIKLTSEADAQTTGPASITTTDPDGNVILIDQHR